MAVKKKPTTVKVLLHFPSRASEWATSVILFNISLLVYFTGGASLGAAHAAMTNIMSPLGWCYLMFILAVIRICLLIVNGELRHSPHFRAGMSFVSCFVWFQIILAHLSSEETFNALAVYPVLFALDFYNAFRVTVEARISDEAKNAGNTDTTD